MSEEKNKIYDLNDKNIYLESKNDIKVGDKVYNKYTKDKAIVKEILIVKKYKVKFLDDNNERIYSYYEIEREFKCKKCGSKKWTVYGPKFITLCKDCGEEYTEK